MTSEKLKLPFPYFGGKKTITPIVWKAFGNIENYIEPFCGSLAVLLNNPSLPKIETVNDIDCGLVNFWRAVSKEPDKVIEFADFPVSETELHARHQWIVSNTTNEFKLSMNDSPDFYDVKMAGYWIYGQSASVGSNWLQPKGLKALPILSSAGGGIHGLTYSIEEQFKKLQERLGRVRIACGDWKRIMSPAITYANKGLSKQAITGIFLDPPYSLKDRDKVYKNETDIYNEVCNWALENGNNEKLRIIVCGYENDFPFPDNWSFFNWRANGGMANIGDSRGKDNAKREMIYFSPSCLDYYNEINKHAFNAQ